MHVIQSIYEHELSWVMNLEVQSEETRANGTISISTFIKILNCLLLPQILERIKDIIFHSRGMLEVSMKVKVAWRRAGTGSRSFKMSLKEIVVMYQSLKREWDKKPQNLDRCGELLTKLKVVHKLQYTYFVYRPLFSRKILLSLSFLLNHLILLEFPLILQYIGVFAFFSYNIWLSISL